MKNSVDKVPELARRIFSGAIESKAIITKIGDDDCGVIQTSGGYIVVKTDLMNHKPALVTLELRDQYFNYGYLLATANLSDLYGSGSVPIAMLIGLIIPPDLNQNAVEQFFEGIQKVAQNHNVTVIGGDTKRGDKLQGYGVALGWADSLDQLFLRNGVKASQDIYLSGPVGDFNAAVYLLSNHLCPAEWELEAHQAITQPRLRSNLSFSLSSQRLATGGIDISDGVGMDLWRMAKASDVGLSIMGTSIPVGPLALKAASQFNIDPLSFVFSTGGDWQFAFSSDSGNRDLCESLGAKWIGTAQEKQQYTLTHGEAVRMLPKFGHSDDRGIGFGKEVQLGMETFLTGDQESPVP
jgi:thiamine-monophosphate kinase